MNRIFMFVAILAASVNAMAADSVTFDGDDYRLAQVGASGTEVANEYLPQGTSSERWDSAFSVRAFKGHSTTDEVIASYLKAMRPKLIDDPLTMKRGGAMDDVVLVMFLKTADTNVVEYDLQRFVRTNGGVVSYRFVQRLPRDVDVTPTLARQPTRIDQLFAMNVPVKERMW